MNEQKKETQKSQVHSFVEWHKQRARIRAPWMFSAFEIGESAALGADVRVEVDPRTTVLVGRNGAGKSALMEGIILGAWGATGVVDDDLPDPGRFACEIRGREVRDLGVRYECNWSPPIQAGAITDIRFEERRKEEGSFAEIAEKCISIASNGSQEILWQLSEQKLQRNDGTTDTLPVGRGLLNWLIAHRGNFVFSNMAEPLYELLTIGGIWHVKAGVPRAYKDRDAVIIPYPWPFSRSRIERRYEHISLPLRRLTLNLVEWKEQQPDKLDEFVQIGRRLRILESIEIVLLPNPEYAADNRAPHELAVVSVDGVNIGLLSDGTLRVMEIVSTLLEGEASLLLIEEPEIAVHPGLLARLLHEIEAYTEDRQVVISTQSPQVVSWAQPHTIRLVERVDKQTHVRRLSKEELERVTRYLSDEGTLGDYLYSGGIDA